MIEHNPLVSIILPVYNRTDYLKEAINSVYQQTYQNWELILADDASDQKTQTFLKQYINNKQVKIYLNTKNLGLFRNLNQAIIKAKGEYIIILCSDDIFLENCLESSVNLINKYPRSNLILSCHKTITYKGNNKSNKNLELYQNWVGINQTDKMLCSEEVLPLLLSNGSINGNITGMFFPKSLFHRIGGFQEEWKQVSDWEWVYRVAKQGNIVLSKIPRTIIRSHSFQLSEINYKTFINSMEVVEMVDILLKDSYISQLKDSKIWANHIMQMHLWYAFKGILAGKSLKAFQLIKKINKTVGLHNVVFAMIKWLPQRWQIYWHKAFPLKESKRTWDSLE